MSDLKIGDLARATGTGVETVRWYEKVGLLARPPRTASNYRSYGHSDLMRLSFIRRARDQGFSIDQIRTMLDLSDDRSRDCATIDAIASENLTEIDRKIADLTALRGELANMVVSCRGGTVADCRILEALAPGQRSPA
jgi:Cu(I)-responsive transcriptional regulator